VGEKPLALSSQEITFEGPKSGNYTANSYSSGIASAPISLQTVQRHFKPYRRLTSPLPSRLNTFQANAHSSYVNTIPPGGVPKRTYRLKYLLTIYRKSNFYRVLDIGALLSIVVLARSARRSSRPTRLSGHHDSWKGLDPFSTSVTFNWLDNSEQHIERRVSGNHVLYTDGYP